MKKHYIYIGAGTLSAIAVAAIVFINHKSCDASSGACPVSQATPTPSPTPAITKVTLDQVKQDLAAGALLVDVREPDEYAAGHAEGAQLLPVGTIQAGTYPTADKAAKIYLYCRTGRRASQALDTMKAAGYQNVVNIGGLSDWQAIGGAVTQPAAASSSAAPQS